MNQTTVQKSNKNQKNRFKSKKSDLNQKKSIFLIFIKKIAIFINPDWRSWSIINHHNNTITASVHRVRLVRVLRTLMIILSQIVCQFCRWKDSEHRSISGEDISARVWCHVSQSLTHGEVLLTGHFGARTEVSKDRWVQDTSDSKRCYYLPHVRVYPSSTRCIGSIILQLPGVKVSIGL